MKILLPVSLCLLMTGSAAPQQAQDRVEALFQRIDAALTKADPFPGGVAALAQRLGGEPAKVAELAAGLDIEPYTGIMKGAEGTLRTGGGSSFDLAVLGAALLGPKAKVRFAIGTVAADKVWSLARNQPSRAVAARPPHEKATAARAEMWKKVDENVALLSRLMDEKGVRLAAAEAAPSTEWCWVEYEKEGKWLPLREPPCEARERFDALPDRYLHQVEISTKLERSEGGKAELHEILRVRYAARDLFGNRLRFVIAPAPDQKGFEKAMIDGKKIRVNPLEGLRKVERFVPGVRLGRGGQYGKAFDLEGKTFTIDASKGFALAGGDVVGNRVGALLGGGPGRERAKGCLTGVWWSVKRISPGLPDQEWEREIADLSGFGQKRGAIAALEPRQADRLRVAFLGSHDVYLDFGRMSLMEGLARWRRTVEPLRAFLREARGYARGTTPLMKVLKSFDRERPAYINFGVLRTLYLRQLEERFKAVSYLPGPGVVILHDEFLPTGPDRVKARETFDIVDLPAAIEGPEGGRFRLALGVLDTELELRACACKPPLYNTASLIRAGKPELRCLTKPAEADALPYKATAKARVKADLQAGHVVVAPAVELEGEAVWWRIDPRTGAALGIGETGCGQTSVEYWLVVYEQIAEAITIGETLLCYLQVIQETPFGLYMLTGDVDDFLFFRKIAACIPLCSGAGKLFDLPEVKFGHEGADAALDAANTINTEILDGPDLKSPCSHLEDWVDGVLTGKD